MNTLKKVIFGAVLLTAISFKVNAQSAGPQVIQHNIYIKLKDASDAKIQEQLKLGKKYLSNHPGQVSLSSGVLAQGITRHTQKPNLNNIQDFDIVFSFVFKDEKAHDVYQVSERHQAFIQQSNANWDNIRILDTKVSQD